MIDEIKLTLRINHDELDNEIKANIEAALLDMARVGIDVESIKIDDDKTYNKLQLKCCEFYCKWMFNHQEKGEQWRAAYENLLSALSLCCEYNGGDCNV